LLTGCLWGPGRFNSALALHKNGSFVLDYKGEILMQLPEEKDTPAVPWSEKTAHCYVDGRTANHDVVEIVMLPPAEEPKADRPKPEERPCTKAELAQLKADYEKLEAERIEKRRQEKNQMAEMLGLPGSDDASNRAFAEKLKKYAGWRSVAYKGKGVFEVDYHFEGRLSQDFAFPLMPDSYMMIPFIAIRKRNDGTLLVAAPALTGGSGPFSARAKAMGLPDKGDDGPKSQAEGRFTILTDGEILTNNSEDGPAPHASGKQVHWDVGPGSTKIPEMLVRL
jgi:hypothetical protein